ncbi:MAG: gliding motility protein GldM [Microscillaceae bacterium]|nr:gliding motility protein GldM [Microscillaceae bacterium]MDW8460558.1 gliding motility protein GldM [Cytophagales bacterium]
MAGGQKETPRQQMIGFMYLVLTCLLALQVSSTIIDKFIFLNNSLEHSLQGAKSASENGLKALKAKIEKEGNSPEGLAALKRADLLKKRTSEIISEIDKIKAILIKEAGDGIDPHTKSVKNPKEETRVEVRMVGEEGTKSGLGYKLEKDLNGFVDWLNKEFKDLKLPKFEPLAEGNAKNPLYAEDPVQRNKDFAQANFAQTPVVAALAVLTQKQNEILRYEQEVLKALGSGDLSADLKFDEITVGVTPEANVLAPGETYKAEMFLAAYSSRNQAVMTKDGAPISVSQGKGKVEFKVPDPGPNAYKDGKAERSWVGTITFKGKGGRDTTFRKEVKYYIAQPVLLVVPKNLNPLYQNCANPLKTAVPALGAAYDPSFSFTAGQAIPGPQKGEVTIIPTALGKHSLKVSSSGNPIGSQEFDVIPVPPPNVYLGNSQGKQIENLDVPINIPPTLTIVAEPDPNFKIALPNEANYRVTAVTVRQFRGGVSIKEQRINGGQINMAQFNARKGDGFTFKVEEVQRINSRGSIEKAPVKNPYQSCTQK